MTRLPRWGSAVLSPYKDNSIAEGARRFRECAQRAGPALPSYLALHHAGFSRLPILLPRRWALTPPFHPCQTNQLCPGGKARNFFEDVSQVSLRDATVLLRRRYILCGTFRN